MSIDLMIHFQHFYISALIQGSIGKWPSDCAQSADVGKRRNVRNLKSKSHQGQTKGVMETTIV